MNREIVGLACEDCKRKNYTTTKNKKLHPDKYLFRRYCSSCRKHTSHKETKV